LPLFNCGKNIVMIPGEHFEALGVRDSGIHHTFLVLWATRRTNYTVARCCCLVNANLRFVVRSKVVATPEELLFAVILLSVALTLALLEATTMR
jgi:hypothetical protein